MPWCQKHSDLYLPGGQCSKCRDIITDNQLHRAIELLRQAVDPCNELFEEWYDVTNVLIHQYDKERDDGSGN